MQAQALKLIATGWSLMFASVCNAALADSTSYSMSNSTRHTFRKGAPEIDTVRQWLRQSGAPDAGLSDPDSIDIVHVSAARSSGGPVKDTSDQQSPLPMQGAAGDTLTITSCSGGTQQSWTQVYAGKNANGWTVTDFVFHANAAACRS